MSDPEPDLLWYAGYGSNLDPARFGFYLAGGRPPGARRVMPGARDADPPREVRPVTVRGRMVFGWESPTWGGGISFLDVGADGVVPATAYLVTREQLIDVAAQEMHREAGPSPDLDLAAVLTEGTWSYGPGRYETLHRVGDLDGAPILTFTCDDPEHLARNAPSGAYLATITRGLRGVHGLDDDAIAGYLSSCEGTETWAPDELRRLVGATR